MTKAKRNCVNAINHNSHRRPPVSRLKVDEKKTSGTETMDKEMSKKMNIDENEEETSFNMMFVSPWSTRFEAKASAVTKITNL